MRYFLLHQKHGPPHGAARGNDPREYRRTDVVRKISREHGRAPPGEIQVEHVGLDQFQAGAEPLAQVRGQVRIQFDGDNPAGAFEQRSGQGAAPGANLNREGLLRPAHRGGDAFENRFAYEKVLAEFSARH